MSKSELKHDNFKLVISDFSNDYSGTKTQTLFSLKGFGFNVPSSFVVRDEVFLRFIDFFNIPSVCDFLSSNSFDDGVQQRILEAEERCEIVFECEQTMCDIDRLIARSSSSIGDFDKDKYASCISGAFDSIVCDKSNLKRAVLEVYASLYSKKAYTQLKLFNNSNIVKAMSVLIQKYIEPAISGLAHLSAASDVFSLDWKVGHLRDIVDGVDSGFNDDIYQSSDGEIIIEGNEIDLAIIEHSNLEEPFIEVYKTLKKIVSHFDGEIEVEWIFDGKDVVVVQCQSHL